MPPSQSQIDAFLAVPKLLGRLATVSPGGQPHVVPVWYLWQDGCIWIHSYRTTRKIGHLQANPHCAFVVDVLEAVEGLTAVMFEGRADLLSEDRSEIRLRGERVYRRYLSPEEIFGQDPETWLDSPEGLLIRITPDRVKAW